ncbi:pirin family protein [Halalkalibacillus sediminis]|uniref:Pirin family protein n=1 Tax=Halalkalibacillus sediminis TaxID=2018042 RepID=A0A2I0QRZ7_9BACI|nr:pirin-like C-terminal cupin domain-containing protein [Halalkalibacillus sediminis]PKR77113.1 pirin family protein [Halalkalibacillus sediminis]
MNPGFNRKVINNWKVTYNENGYPHVQQAFVLPPDQFEAFDPFLLMAEDWFKRGTFSDHPHCGFQTVTYVIDGRLEHIDNSGGHEVLEANDMQYMNAGKGARHAEEPVEDDIVHSLQLWLNLPKEQKKSDPYYQNVYAEDAEVKRFDGGMMRVYAGSFDEKSGPLNSLVPFGLAEMVLKEGVDHTLTIPANHNAFVYVLQGEIEVGEEGQTLKKSSVGLLDFDEEASDESDSHLKIHANHRSKFLVYTGKPVREEVVARGPFITNTMEEMKKAYQDFRDGKFGAAVKS